MSRVWEVLTTLEGHLAACEVSILPGLVRRLGSLAEKATRRLSRGGRPGADIDWDEVLRHARKGQWKPAYLAYCVGVPKQTLLGPKYAEKLREVIEQGRALFESDALDEYQEFLSSGGKGFHPTAMSGLIFKMKQIGWTDRASAGGEAWEPESEGSKDRFLALVAQYKENQKQVRKAAAGRRR